MEPEFWHQRWREGRIGFHEEAVNPRLVDHFEALELAPGEGLFVPLCGKSLDMAWLAERGHPVLGVELSERAVRDYFDERGCEPSEEQGKRLRRLRAGTTTLLVGDLFELCAEDLAGTRGVYDRGALVALPVPMRAAYAAHMAALLPSGTPYLLVVVEYEPGALKGPPFSIPDEEVRGLFGAAFEVRRLEEDSGPHVVGRLAGRGLGSLREAVFLLTRR